VCSSHWTVSVPIAPVLVAVTMEACIVTAPLEGGGFALSDNKPEGADLKPLHFSETEITDFAREWMATRA